ncbi:hypothetical protein D9M72_604990 [compost metagenome]
MSAAITTIDRHMRMVWLTPAIIEGAAVGRSILKRMNERDAPKASAASRTEAGTDAMPSAVSRTTGGMPKMMVAMMPDGLPMPKSAMTGIR